MAREVDVTIKGKNEAGPAFRQAAQDAESLKGGIEKLLNPMDALKGAIAGLGLTALAEFFKSSVEAASAWQAAMARVSSALDNIGISSNLVTPQLEKLFAKIQDTTRFADEDAAGAFADLVNISGDYAGSVKNLTLVTDIAVARQIDLHTAATLVGRVMNGDTQMLKRYGIEVKDNAHAMDELTRKFSGFAERDGDSLQGRINQLSHAWEDFKKNLGLAITGADSMTTGVGQLTDQLKRLSDWIQENKSSIEGITNFFTFVGKWTIAKPVGAVLEWLSAYDQLFEMAAELIGRGQRGADAQALDDANFRAEIGARHQAALKAREELRANAAKVRREREAREAEEAQKARDKYLEGLGKEAASLGELRKAGLLTAADIGKALETLHALETELASGHVTDAQRVSLAKAAKDAREAIALSGLAAPGVGVTGPHTTAAGIVGGPKTVTAAAAPNVGQVSFAQQIERGFDAAGKAAAKANVEIETVGESLGRTGHEAAVAFRDSWVSAIDDVIEGHQSLGASIVKEGKRAVAGVLVAEGRAALAEAAVAAAKGFSNPLKFIEAGKLALAGAGELALAASLGSGGGGYGGGGGGLSSAGIAQTQNDVAHAGKVTVYLSGSKTILDHNNPDDMASLKDALQQLAGNREIDFVVTA